MRQNIQRLFKHNISLWHLKNAQHISVLQLYWYYYFHFSLKIGLLFQSESTFGWVSIADPLKIATIDFLQSRCPFCHTTNTVKALKKAMETMTIKSTLIKHTSQLYDLDSAKIWTEKVRCSSNIKPNLWAECVIFREPVCILACCRLSLIRRNSGLEELRVLE